MNFCHCLVNQHDQYHKQAVELSNKYQDYPFVTTEAVLLEIGNALARNYKEQANSIIQDFRTSDDVEIIHLSHTLFSEGYKLFRKYVDKTWSLVDCVSFVVMNDKKITDALTVDKHFE